MNTLPLPKFFLRLAAVLALAAALLPGALAQAEASAVSVPVRLTAFEQVDARQGWILFGGRMYWTEDDGAAWTDITPPLADLDTAHFLDASHGWAVASDANGFLLASTTDGGAHWKTRPLNLPALNTLDAPIAKVFMGWRTEEHGWLALKLATNSNFSRGVLYVTYDGGGTWLSRPLPLGEPVTFTTATEARVTGGPAGNQTFRTRDGGLRWESAPGNGINRPVEPEAGFVERSMSSEESGWAKWESGECADGLCTREVKLLSTQDGVHWETVRLPDGSDSLREQFSLSMKSPLFSDIDTQPYVGQGFDTCEIPSLAKMQAWWNGSPYTAVNLYIGGIARACANSALTASYVSQINAQGWRFFPTWVGLQASCSGFLANLRMSSDPAIAYTQGVAEAEAAIAAAQALGLTESDGSGTVIYYDLEAYNTTNATCRAAANSFINGWTFQMQARGNLAGVYGASCASAPTDWWSNPNVPDALWVANWVEDAYTPTATVWNAACLSNSLWPNHQRLRQYAGGHNETWGGQTINIDSNVLDGPVTVPDGAGDSPPPASPSGLSAVTVGSTLVNLTWSLSPDEPDIDNYLVFANDVQIASLAGGVNNYQAQNLACNTSFSFQVKAVHLGVQSKPSNTAVAATPPCAPVLVYPLGIVADSLKPAFTWQPVVGATQYQIVVSLNPSFTSPAVNSKTTSFTYTPANNLLADKLYYWRVRAIGTLGYGDWSSSTFTTPLPPPAPVLISPAVNALVTDYTPRFDWKDVIAPAGTTLDYYRIQIASDLTFSAILHEENVTLSEFNTPTEFAPNTRYYWRVRACNTLGHFGPWSIARSFRTAMSPPTLVSPVDGANLFSLRPAFDWDDTAGASGYTLQISRVSNFASLVRSVSVINSAYTATTDVPANLLLYWRVRANGVNGPSLWSTVWSFYSPNPPSIPVLISPAPNALLLTTTPLLDWSDSVIPMGTTYLGYHLQVATDKAFTNFVEDLFTGFLPSESYYVTSPLQNGTTYYWRVRVFNVYSEYSSWSLVRNFRVAYAAPSLLAPVDAATDVPLQPTFAWDAISGATSYTLQVSTSDTFTTFVFKKTVLAPGLTYTHFLPLNPNIVYYWRVRANGAYGPGFWQSPSFSFTTAP